jgi:hypothetical protein
VRTPRRSPRPPGSPRAATSSTSTRTIRRCAPSADARTAQAAADPDVDYLYGAVADAGRALVGFRHDETLADAAHPPIRQLAVAVAS